MKAILFYEDRNMVYKNIRRLRKKKRLSQTDLAAKMQVMNVNIDQQMISKIERNRRFVTDFELAFLFSENRPQCSKRNFSKAAAESTMAIAPASSSSPGRA